MPGRGFLWEHLNVKTDLRWTDDYRNIVLMTILYDS